MPDASFVDATLPRYLALNPGMAATMTTLPRAQVAVMLHAWLRSDQAQRAILREEIARSLEGTEEDGAG